MKTRTLGTVAATLLIAFGVGSVQARPSGAHARSPVEGQMVVQIIGEVRAVDVAGHSVTVVDTQGHATSLNVSADMHDLDKLPLGTRVKSAALQPVSLTPVRHAPLQEAIPGDKRFVAQVTNIDAKAGIVLLKDADNLPIEIRMRNAQQASKFASGETVRVDLQNATGTASGKKH